MCEKLRKIGRESLENFGSFFQGLEIENVYKLFQTDAKYFVKLLLKLLYK